LPGPLPVFWFMPEDRDFESEQLLAYEAGIRVQPNDAFYWDLAVFFNNYDNLEGAAPAAYAPGPFGGWPLLYVESLANGTKGETYGFELAGSYEVNPCWTIHASYSFLRMAMHSAPGTGTYPEAWEGQNPRNQVYVGSSWDLNYGLELDLIGRYVDSLPAFAVPSYLVMDLRLAWQPTPNLELAVVGRHLLDAEHPEFGDDPYLGDLRTEVQQEVYGSVTWRY